MSLKIKEKLYQLTIWGIYCHYLAKNGKLSLLAYEKVLQNPTINNLNQDQLKLNAEKLAVIRKSTSSIFNLKISENEKSKNHLNNLKDKLYKIKVNLSGKLGDREKYTKDLKEIERLKEEIKNLENDMINNKNKPS